MAIQMMKVTGEPEKISVLNLVKMFKNAGGCAFMYAEACVGGMPYNAGAANDWMMLNDSHVAVIRTLINAEGKEEILLVRFEKKEN